MKKLMFAAAVAAMAMGAQAGASWYSICFSPAEGDNVSETGTGNLSQYQLYLLNGTTYDDAIDFVSGNSISAVAGSALASATSIERGVWVGAYQQYVMDDGACSAIMKDKNGGTGYLNDINDYNKAILVAYYGSDEGSGYTPLEYNVIGAYPSLELFFDDYSPDWCSATGWTTYSVPEPTSALLMLLGMAGLALKRKVA